MSGRMEFAIVLNSKPVRVRPYYQPEREDFSWKVVLKAKVVPHNNPDQLVEAAQNYCKRLNDILGKDESGKKKKWQLCAHFKGNINTNKQLAVRVHGRLLEELRGLCGETPKFRFEWMLRTICRPRLTSNIITLEPMPARSYDTIDQFSNESSCDEFNHVTQAYCEELVVMVSHHIFRNDLDWMAARKIGFVVTDTYINLPTGGGSFEEMRYQLDVFKTIMRHEASSDISIHGVNGFKVAAHKCFLIAHSSVLKEMVEQCRFGRLKLRDVSVNCVKALLEYIYKFQTPSLAVQSSKVAMELFVLANKYEMYALQDKLAKMMLERINSWFHITETLDLFLFIRSLGRTSTIDELIGKIAQVLNWNGKKRIMKSEGYQRLVIGDLNAAKELCAAMANAN